MHKEVTYAVATLMTLLVVSFSVGLYFYFSREPISMAEQKISNTQDELHAEEVADWMLYNKSTISGSKVFALLNTYNTSDKTIALSSVDGSSVLTVGKPIVNGTFDGQYFLADQHNGDGVVNSVYGNIVNFFEDVSFATSPPYSLNIESLYTTYIIKDSGGQFVGIYLTPVIITGLPISSLESVV